MTTRVLLLLAAWTLPAFATDKPKDPPQHQDQDQSQTQSQTVNAGGGQGGGASNNLSMGGDRTLALANGAPIPAVCPSGLVPGKRGKRAINWGLGGLSAVCVIPTPEETAAMQVIRDHELAIAKLAVEAARAEAERDRAAAERIRAETECLRCEVRK